MRLNKVQRGIAIAAAAAIVLIQLVAFEENGVSDSRGWMWSFLAAAVLLAIAFGTHDSAPSATRTDVVKAQPSQPTGKAPSPEQMQEYAGHMGRAIGLVNANSLAAKEIVNWIVSTGRYHKEGPLAFVFDAHVHAGLAAHAIFVLSLRAASSQPETIVWETYRTTLANRLADKRLATFLEQDVVKERAPGLKDDKEMRRDFVEQVKGEMRMWEDIATRSEERGDGVLQFAAGIFRSETGTVTEQEKAALRPLFEQLLADASRSIPMLAAKLA